MGVQEMGAAIDLSGRAGDGHVVGVDERVDAFALRNVVAENVKKGGGEFCTLWDPSRDGTGI